MVVTNATGADPLGFSTEELPPEPPPGEKKDVIPRDQPEPTEKRQRLVTAWIDKVKAAKSHWEPAFKRMREDQEFCYGKQWSKDSKDPRYVANLTLRMVAQKTAFLYAKNPKAVAKKRQRMNAESWDETQSTLNQLMQSGAMMVSQGQQMAAAGQVPPDMMGQLMGPMMGAAQGVMGTMMPGATGGPVPGAMGLGGGPIQPPGGPGAATAPPPMPPSLGGGGAPPTSPGMPPGAPGMPPGGPGAMGGGPSLNAISGAVGGALGGSTMPASGGGPTGLGDSMSAMVGGAAAGQIPGVHPLMAQAVGSGVDIMMDAARVKNENVMLDKLSRTLQLLYEYEIANQPAPFKALMKLCVRRTCTTGVGFVKLGFERVMSERPDLMKGVADASERLGTLERLAADAADDITDENDAEAEQLKLLLQDMQREANIIVREGLTFDYPLAWNVIPDPHCCELRHWTGAEWIAEEHMLSSADVEEIYGIDVRGHCNEYSAPDLNGPDPVTMAQEWGADRKWDDRSGKKTCVWEVYCRKDGLVYVVCDGYKDFLREPASPDVWMERFYPWFCLLFNEVDCEKELYPPSDVRIMRDMQKEYNRCREGLKEQRIAARPFIAAVAGALDDYDKDRLTEREANDIIELNALQPNQDIKNLLQPYAGPGVDPNLYEVGPVYEDVLRTTGIQEANLGGTSNSTATQANIAEGSRMTSMGSNIDDLNDLLTELARTGGQVLLREMSPDMVKKIVGQGAVWPQASAQEIAQDVLLEIEAGSMGRPNAAAEIANAQRIYPLLIQLPGIDPEFLAKDLLRRLDDRLDLTEAFKSNLPSIIAMNGMRSGAAPGAGAGPGAGQGPQGAANAPSPAQPAPGGPPDVTGGLTGAPPGQPHPGGAPAMPGMPG